MVGHDFLLFDGAVVLDAEDDGVVGGVEGVPGDGVLDHLLEEDLGSEGPTVVDDGLSVVTVPAVQLNATAPLWK